MINVTQAQYAARKELQPYSGNSPYIFISYSHGDSQKVRPIVERLLRDGYRVWFDEGIDPGEEWSKNIVTRLKNSEVCLAFISKNYLESSNCLDELDYARNHVKHRILIYIEDVKLPDEVDMRHSRIQAIHKYRYQKEEAFYRKLYEATILEACIEKGEEGGDGGGTGPAPGPEKPPVKLIMLLATILVIFVAAVILLRGCSVSEGSDANNSTVLPVEEDDEEEVVEEVIEEEQIEEVLEDVDSTDGSDEEIIEEEITTM